MPEVGDVVLTTEAPLGEVGRIQELPVGLAQRIVTLRGKEGVLHNGYLLYALQSEEMQGRLRDRSTGTTVLGIKQSELRKVEIELPPFTYQEEVAEILGCLDDRIDLLRQTNATLEAIAQALFKSWFVDFDPVRAKAEGREPEGMDPATAALFPSEFKESELGLIPKGWRVRRVEQLATKIAMGPFGSNIKVSTFVGSGVPVISGQHLRGALLEENSFNFITPDHANKLSNSVVVEGDIVFTHAGNIGQVSLVPSGAKHSIYVLSQRQFYLRCNRAESSPEFLVYFFRSPAGQQRLLANASQVGVPSIARPASYLKSIELIPPPPEIAHAFSAVVSALHDRIVRSLQHIGALQECRHTLLPRLISGKLRMPNSKTELSASMTQGAGNGSRF